MENGRVDITFTLSCAFTGEILRSTHFETSGRMELPMREELMKNAPGELHGMLPSIWPSLVALDRAMALAYRKRHIKG